jgi:hypothetical protein
MMRRIILLLALLATLCLLAGAAAPTLDWYLVPDGEFSELRVTLHTTDVTVTHFLVTVAWEADYHTETVVRLVPVSQSQRGLSVQIPAEIGAVRILRIQAIPLIVKGRDIVLLTPGVRDLPK